MEQLQEKDHGFAGHSVQGTKTHALLHCKGKCNQIGIDTIPAENQALILTEQFSQGPFHRLK